MTTAWTQQYGRLLTDNCAMFPGVVANIGERLPADPGQRPPHGDHLGNEHSPVSAFRHLKSPRASLTMALIPNAAIDIARDDFTQTTTLWLQGSRLVKHY